MKTTNIKEITPCPSPEMLNRAEIVGVIGMARAQKAGESLVVKISVATNYAYVDREGCPVMETTWHTISATVPADTDVNALFRKGRAIRAVGRLRTMRYVRQDGSEATCYEILAQDIELYDEKLTCQQ